MFDLPNERLQQLKNLYKPGTRVRCVSMEDPWNPIKPGTEGTVSHVDDIGTIHVSWDTGSSLGLVYGEDVFEIVRRKKI